MTRNDSAGVPREIDERVDDLGPVAADPGVALESTPEWDEPESETWNVGTVRRCPWCSSILDRQRRSFLERLWSTKVWQCQNCRRRVHAWRNPLKPTRSFTLRDIVRRLPAKAQAPEPRPMAVEELEQQLALATEKLQSVLLVHRRDTDEFEQARMRFRRGVARETERERRAVLVEMLDVVDNLDRAIAATHHMSRTDGSDAVLRGIQLVREQFLAKLEAFGVTRLEAVGKPFDPRSHDAMSTTPVDDESQDDLVVSIVREGYLIGEDVLRPAGVVVGKYA